MKKLFLAFVATLGFMTVNADNVVTVESPDMTSGEKGEINVSLKTDASEFSAYQFHMYVPAGMTFSNKTSKVFSDGDLTNEDSSGVSFKMGAQDGALGKLDGYDCYLITAYDGDNLAFQSDGEGGLLVTINYTGGEFTPKDIILTGIVLARPNGTKATIEKVTGIRTIAATTANTAANSKVYGIDGVQKAQATKGLNIVNGKKVVK